jgi:hypothetical protein
MALNKDYLCSNVRKVLKKHIGDDEHGRGYCGDLNKEKQNCMFAVYETKNGRAVGKPFCGEPSIHQEFEHIVNGKWKEGD